jgi:hypothetical protein
MKNSVEHILNRFGWKTTNGRVEYRGFEFLLNVDVQDWRTVEPIEEDCSVRTESGANVDYQYRAPKHIEPIELSPEESTKQLKSLEYHNQLVAAQKRVAALKVKAKEKDNK